MERIVARLLEFPQLFTTAVASVCGEEEEGGGACSATSIEDLVGMAAEGTQWPTYGPVFVEDDGVVAFSRHAGGIAGGWSRISLRHLVPGGFRRRSVATDAKVAFAGALMCTVDLCGDAGGVEIFVCNLLLRKSRQLPRPPKVGGELWLFHIVPVGAHEYTLFLLSRMDSPSAAAAHSADVVVQMYHSAVALWTTTTTTVSAQLDDSVNLENSASCVAYLDGCLYCMVKGGDDPLNLLRYNVAEASWTPTVSDVKLHGGEVLFDCGLLVCASKLLVRVTSEWYPDQTDVRPDSGGSPYILPYTVFHRARLYEVCTDPEEPYRRKVGGGSRSDRATVLLVHMEELARTPPVKASVAIDFLSDAERVYFCERDAADSGSPTSVYSYGFRDRDWSFPCFLPSDASGSLLFSSFQPGINPFIMP